MVKKCGYLRRRVVGLFSFGFECVVVERLVYFVFAGMWFRVF